MRQLLSFLFAAVMAFPLTACGSNDEFDPEGENAEEVGNDPVATPMLLFYQAFAVIRMS